jgi:hypothetical protein
MAIIKKILNLIQIQKLSIVYGKGLAFGLALASLDSTVKLCNSCDGAHS